MLFMQRVRMNWGSLISNLLKHTYTDTHTTMDKEQKGCGCRSDLNTITSGLTIAVIYLFFYISSLSFSLSLFFLYSVNFTLIKHFTTTLPFCQNTIFLLLFIVFLLQNMYRLFRTTTKIQYPIYMQFILFNNHQFIS